MAHSTGTIPRRWSVADSREVYAVRQWGGRYFDINDSGNLTAFPAELATSGSTGTASSGSPGNAAQQSAPLGIDLKELVDEVRERGIGLPLLIRFPEILKSRIVDLNEVFRNAINEYGYKGLYRGVYPVIFDVTQSSSTEHLYRSIFSRLLELQLVKSNDLVILTKGEYAGTTGGTNSMQILKVALAA